VKTAGQKAANTSTPTPADAGRCKAVVKKTGAPCENKDLGNGFCGVHKTQASQQNLGY
jgi:hypothetical protein